MFIGCKVNFITASRAVTNSSWECRRSGEKARGKEPDAQVDAVGLIGCNLRKV